MLQVEVDIYWLTVSKSSLCMCLMQSSWVSLRPRSLGCPNYESQHLVEDNIVPYTPANMIEFIQIVNVENDSPH